MAYSHRNLAKDINIIMFKKYHSSNKFSPENYSTCLTGNKYMQFNKMTIPDMVNTNYVKCVHTAPNTGESEYAV